MYIVLPFHVSNKSRNYVSFQNLNIKLILKTLSILLNLPIELSMCKFHLLTFGVLRLETDLDACLPFRNFPEIVEIPAYGLVIQIVF